MTLQQLQYLLALDNHRQFVQAADECGVAQPTLSAMISKLEKELDVQIFDRSKKPLEPTPLGLKIIQQARNILRESNKISELIDVETQTITGLLRIGIIPTLAPYLLPDFIQKFQKNYPQVQLKIKEQQTDQLLEQLMADELDLCIAATPLGHEDTYEIPLYYESFVAYMSPEHPASDQKISAKNMPKKGLWTLGRGHCLRDQVFNFCKTNDSAEATFQAGSIDTLIRIVDTNGGYTVIPTLHTKYLKPTQRKKLKTIDSPPAVREISIVIHKNYVREKLLNAVSDTIKDIIPDEMLNTKLKKYSIKLR